jgi:hypothetical protein
MSGNGTMAGNETMEGVQNGTRAKVEKERKEVNGMNGH